MCDLRVLIFVFALALPGCGFIPAVQVAAGLFTIEHYVREDIELYEKNPLNFENCKNSNGQKEERK